MTKHTLLLLALGSAAFCGALVSCDRSDSDAPAAEQAQAPGITVFPILQQEVTDYNDWFGYLRGEKDTDIHPHITGFLTTQEYKEGQYVKEGDVLFRIDDSLFRAQLAQAEANLAAAEADVLSATAAREQAELDAKRFENMGSRVISEKDISDARSRAESARAAEDAARAAVKQATAAVQKARIDLDYTVIRAPYSGIAGTAAVSQGDLVSPATKLTALSAVDTMRVLFGINGERMVKVFRKYGDLSTPDRRIQETPFHLILEDETTYPVTGHFHALESKVSANGVINVEGRFANPTHTLRSGMPVRVRIPVHTETALLVPQPAVQTMLRNRFILIVDKENVPHMVPVTVAGEYKVNVKEENGYASTQTMLAVKGAGTPLAELFAGYGYDSPAGVPVVCDSQNGVAAMKVSAANSRRSKGSPAATIQTAPFTFKPAVDPALAAAAKEAENPSAPNPDAKPTLPPFPVKVMPMVLQSVQVPGEWFGTLRGVEETEIRPQVSGFLIGEHVHDGRMVKKGDVLFTIDPAPFQAALDEARANADMAQAELKRSEAGLEMNRLNHERYLAIVKANPGAVADKTITDAATAVKTAEAALLRARANVEQTAALVRLAEINLGYTTITAPFDGRVGIHKHSEGALVSPQDPEPLVTLSSMNPMRVDFRISGKDALAGIRNFTKARAAGQDAAEHAPLDILLEDGSLFPAKGKITHADNAIDTATGTLLVSALVENADGGLRSGMPVRVRADISGARQSILVPARAPLSNGGRDLLVLLKPDNTPEMLPITKLDMVTVPVAEEGGQQVVQPMQMIDVDRNTVAALMLLQSGAPSLESLVLQGAGVSNWGELLLKNANAADFREAAGCSDSPDDIPASVGAADWEEYLLRMSGAANMRELVLSKAGAKDELDLIARAQGYGSVFEMVLRRMGYNDPSEVRVVVEGSIMAAQVYGANKAAGAPVNKLTPLPFRYNPPKTVVDSVTAEKKNL